MAVALDGISSIVTNSDAKYEVIIIGDQVLFHESMMTAITFVVQFQVVMT